MVAAATARASYAAGDLPGDDASPIEAALAYAALGWPVFPVAPDDSKAPLTPHGFKEASTDPATIRAWWTRHPAALVAVPMGPPTGLWALDSDPGGIDPETGEEVRPHGEESLAELVQQFGPLPATLTQLTPRGGLHRLFRWNGESVRSRSGDIAPSLDVRGVNSKGEASGSLILAPSRRQGRGAYRWEGDAPSIADIAVAPGWLVYLATFGIHDREQLAQHGINGPADLDADPRLWPARLEKIRAADRAERQRAWEAKGGARTDISRDRYFAAVLDDELNKLARTGSNRNSALNIAALKLGRYAALAGWSDDDLADRLLNAAHVNGYVGKDGERAARLTIASGLRAGLRDPKFPPPPKPRSDYGDGTMGRAFNEAAARDRAERAGGPQAEAANDQGAGDKREGPQDDTGAKASAGAGAAEILFDPFDEYLVPRFPLDVLPAPLRRFVETQSANLGADAAGIAMSALAALGSALSQKFAIKLKRHSPWYAAPRLWVMLVGHPSSKKTPILKAATGPLEQHQSRVQSAWRRLHGDWKAAKEAGEENLGPEPQPPARFVSHDATIEKMQEILARSPRGILHYRDELSGWIGAMEKYGGGGKGPATDRAFWLQSYSGGPYTSDRVSRGEVDIENLAVAVLGGIQPDRLAELRGLTSDGLLQRFLPVMLNAASPSLDIETGAADEGYDRLMTAFLNASPERVLFNPDGFEYAAKVIRRLEEMAAISDGFAAGYQGFVGKLPGVFGSLALILHMLEFPTTGGAEQVTRKSAEGAERLLMEFIVPHGAAFYQTAEAADGGDRLRAIASYIITSGKKRLTPSDLTKNVWPLRGADLPAVHKAVSPLIAGGWLEPEGDGPPIAARAWLVNPALESQMAERREAEEARKQTLAAMMNSFRRRRE